MSPEIRRDYLLERYAIFAPSRGRRPSDFKVVSASEQDNSRCPFCPGKEDQTPMATYALLEEDGEIKVTRDEEGKARVTGWLVRAFPNLYPAFSSELSQLTVPPEGVPVPESAYGYHEVLVESPIHNQHFWLAPERQTQLVLRAVLDRVESFSKDDKVRAIMPFRNHGREAGASLSHAHTQIVASSFVPPILAQEDQAFSSGRSLSSVASEEELSDRHIYSNDQYVAFASWAGVTPYSFMIVPRQQSPTPVGIDLKPLSDVLRKTLGALHDILNDPPFNLVWHISPLPWSEHPKFHWHIEVYPKLSIWAGYELGSGTYINVVTPESAAQYLKAAVEKRS